MQERHQVHRDKLDKLRMSLRTLTDIRARSDMWKLYNNTRIIWTELDKEMVLCRRRATVTLKYTELEAQYTESINIFDQWTTMATLIYA